MALATPDLRGADLEWKARDLRKAETRRVAGGNFE